MSSCEHQSKCVTWHSAATWLLCRSTTHHGTLRGSWSRCCLYFSWVMTLIVCKFELLFRPPFSCSTGDGLHGLQLFSMFFLGGSAHNLMGFHGLQPLLLRPAVRPFIASAPFSPGPGRRSSCLRKTLVVRITRRPPQECPTGVPKLSQKSKHPGVSNRIRTGTWFDLLGHPADDHLRLLGHPEVLRARARWF